MKSFFVLLLLLVASAVTAQTSRVSKGDLLKQRQYQTNGNLTFYVDPLGNDANQCTSTTTAACLTIQGALNKAPKLLRHSLTVNIAAGSYAGFLLSGFRHDVGIQQATGGITISGTLANSTGLASGTATGTATAGTQGSHATYATLTDSGQAWTANDLRGRFLILTGGTGAPNTRVISSNTGTVITTVYTMVPPPDATTTYAIQDAASIISTGIATPAAGDAVSVANSTGVYVAGNDSDYTSGATTVLIKNLRFQNVSANGITVRSGIALALDAIQFADGSATSNRILASTGGSSVRIQYVSSMTSSTTLRHASLGESAGSAVLYSLFQNGGVGIAATGPFGSTGLNITALETIGSQIGGIAIKGGHAGLDALHIACATVVGNAGIQTGWDGLGAAPASSGRGGTSMYLTSSIVTGCDSAIRLRSDSTIDIETGVGGVSGTAVAEIFDVIYGGLAVLENGSVTISGAANEISLDNGGVNSTIAAVSVNSCITSMGYQSSVCKR